MKLVGVICGRNRRKNRVSKIYYEQVIGPRRRNLGRQLSIF